MGERFALNKEEYTILVVDDQLEILELVVPVLEEEGYRVMKAQSGMKAIDIVRNNQVDIMLLDYFMPGMSGEEVVQEIRNFNKELVILLQTGYAGEKPPLEMLEALDIQGYHDKTEGIDKLMLWVTACVRACAQTRQVKQAFEEVALANQTIKAIKENQEKLIEQERLASLGELMGSITDKMASRLMCISSMAYVLDEVINEYNSSIEDEGVTKEDHHQIAKEMHEHVASMKKYCSSMSDMLKAIHEQSIRMTPPADGEEFILDAMVKMLGTIFNNELVKNHCTLKTDFQVDMNTKIKGNIINMIHVITNLAKNAVDGYEGKGGNIKFAITRKGESIEFSIKDYGAGVPKKIQDKLFKELVTTKDVNGTGLGLYAANSIVKGKFGGRMWFESEEGKGSTFFVSIPVNQEG